MIRSILVFFLVVTLSSHAQENLWEPHKITFSPLSLTNSHQNFVGQAISYRYDHKGKFQIQGDLDGVLLKNLDGRYDLFSTKKAHRNFLRSGANISVPIIKFQPKEVESFKFKTRFVDILGGYHFMQQARTYEDFWSIDSLPDNQVQRVSHFHHHLVHLGISLRMEKWETSYGFNRLYFRNEFSFNYLQNIHFKYFQYTEENNELISRSEHQSSNKNLTPNYGAQFIVKSTFFPTPDLRLKLFISTEFMVYPGLIHKPNPMFEVLRGGEQPRHLINIKTGVTFVIFDKNRTPISPSS